MNERTPLSRGSTRRPGGMQVQTSGTLGSLTAHDLVLRLDLRERLQAIVDDELDLLDAEVDVPRTIAEGCLEELDLLLAEDAA